MCSALLRGLLSSPKYLCWHTFGLLGAYPAWFYNCCRKKLPAPILFVRKHVLYNRHANHSSAKGNVSRTHHLFSTCNYKYDIAWDVAMGYYQLNTDIIPWSNTIEMINWFSGLFEEKINTKYTVIKQRQKCALIGVADFELIQCIWILQECNSVTFGSNRNRYDARQ